MQSKLESQGAQVRSSSYCNVNLIYLMSFLISFIGEITNPVPPSAAASTGVAAAPLKYLPSSSVASIASAASPKAASAGPKVVIVTLLVLQVLLLHYYNTCSGTSTIFYSQT